MIPTDPATPAPASSRLAVALLLGTLLTVLAFSSFDVYNYDIPIYLRKGAHTLATGEIPTPDRFLFADFKESIRGKEKWLFQLVVVTVHRALGWLGLVLLRMAVVVSAFFVVFRMGRGADGTGALPAAAITLLALVCAHERFGVRPELPSILFAALDLWLLTRDRTARDRWVWGVVAAQVLWVNMHSSHPIGLGLAGMALAGAIARWACLRAALPWGGGVSVAHEWAGVMRSARIVGAVLLASFVSPAPIENAWYPWNLALFLYRKAPWFSEAIYEILPPFHAPELFPTWALAAYQLLLVISCVALLSNLRRADPFHVLVHVAFLLYSLSMRRNLSYFAVLCGPIAAWNLAALPVLRARWIRLGGSVLCLGAAAWLVLATISNEFYQADRSTRRTGFGLSRLAYPIAADEFLARQNVRGNIITNWDAGSWLAFTSYPERLPYIHSEGDYNFELFDSYRKLMSGRLDYREVVARHDVRAFLLRHTAGDVRPLVVRLRQDPNWVLAFLDETACVFVRDLPEYATWLAAARIVLPAADEVAVAEPRLTGAPAPASGTVYGLLSAWPDFGATFDRARAAMNLGSAYGLLGRVDLEAAQYLKAIDACAGMPEAHNNLGACFAQSGRIDAAERELLAALALKDDYPSAHRNLGLLRLSHARGPDAQHEAIAHLERAVALNRTEVAAWLDLSRGLTEVGDLTAAASALEQAVAIDPDDPRPDSVLLRLYTEGLQDAERAAIVRQRIQQRAK